MIPHINSCTHRVFEAAECSQFTDSGFLSLTNVSIDCGIEFFIAQCRVVDN